MKPAPPNEEVIFNAAQQFRDPNKQREYLDLACAGAPELRARIERLLRAGEEAEDFFEEKGGKSPLDQELDATISAEPLAEQPGTRIGRYKLLQQIGEGGCGVVFMAEQEEPVRRKVALKIIKLGMDTRTVIARFEAERQALALMDHPNIARVLDGGATETGRPYFVMELVRGVPITQFCDKNKLALNERLKLFIQVCQAIQHAHQKGVIHRDIKPSNILVTLDHGEPIPKVIDFGIAKAINQRLTEKTLFTNYAQLIGTPAYMSPEQAEMSSLDIDTRADVYSLGVLLYELLTGTTPIPENKLRSAGYSELARLIVEVEAERPSTRLSTMVAGERSAIATNRSADSSSLSRLFRSDLDWIAMKALEKDRRRRYETPNELLADVQRHLRNEPVLAKPPSTVYKIQKFVRRNKAPVALAASIFVALFTILVLGSISYQRERAARVDAETARRGEATERHRASQAAELAQRETTRAAEEAARARSNREEARRNEYAADMLLAQKYIAENNRGTALQILGRHIPAAATNNAEKADLRGWEWHYLASLSRGQELATLEGHPTAVNDVVFSPDGRWIASSGGEGVVCIWDSHSRALVRKLVTDHTRSQNEVFKLAFSPDGSQLAGAYRDGRQVYVWHTDTWREAFVLQQTHFVQMVAFSPDGRLLAASGFWEPGGLTRLGY